MPREPEMQLEFDQSDSFIEISDNEGAQMPEEETTQNLTPKLWELTDWMELMMDFTHHSLWRTYFVKNISVNTCVCVSDVHSEQHANIDISIPQG